MTDDNIEHVGEDLGEKPRTVEGEPFTDDDADVFTKMLGLDS